MNKKIVFLLIICIILGVANIIKSFYLDLVDANHKKEEISFYDNFKQYVKTTKTIRKESLQKYLKPLNWKKDIVIDDSSNILLTELDTIYFENMEIDDVKLQNIFLWRLDVTNTTKKDSLNNYIIVLSVKKDTIVDVLVFQDNLPKIAKLTYSNSIKWEQQMHWVTFIKKRNNVSNYPSFYVDFFNKIWGGRHVIHKRDFLSYHTHPYRTQHWGTNKHGYFILLKDLYLFNPETDFDDYKKN